VAAGLVVEHAELVAAVEGLGMGGAQDIAAGVEGAFGVIEGFGGGAGTLVGDGQLMTCGQGVRVIRTEDPLAVDEGRA
jgi:hypothetical protein